MLNAHTICILFSKIKQNLFSDTPIAATIEDQSGGPTNTVPFPGSKQPAPQASAKGLRGGWNDYYKKPYWNDYYGNNKPYWGKPYWKPSSWGYRGSRGANRGGNNKNKSFWGSSSTSDRWESSNQGWGYSNQNYWGPSTTSNQNYWGSPSSSTSPEVDSVPETEDQDFGSASFIVEDPEENEEEEGADFDNRPPESFESPPVEEVGPEEEEEVGFDNGPPEGFGQPPPGVNANGPEEEEEVGQPPEGFGALPNGPEAEEEGADFGNGPPVGAEFGARPPPSPSGADFGNGLPVPVAVGAEFGAGPPPSPSGPEAEFGVGPPLNEEHQAALRILPLKTSNSADTYSSRGITCAVVAALYISLS